jgi:hypothetical protein
VRSNFSGGWSFHQSGPSACLKSRWPLRKKRKKLLHGLELKKQTVKNNCRLNLHIPSVFDIWCTILPYCVVTFKVSLAQYSLITVCYLCVRLEFMCSWYVVRPQLDMNFIKFIIRINLVSVEWTLSKTKSLSSFPLIATSGQCLRYFCWMKILLNIWFFNPLLTVIIS